MSAQHTGPYFLFRIASSAPLNSGCRNWYPLAASFVGSTRWLARKSSFAHFSENQPNHKGWHRKNRRAPENRGQSSCELRIRHRNGRDRVDRTLQLSRQSTRAESRPRHRRPKPNSTIAARFPAVHPDPCGRVAAFSARRRHPAHHYSDAHLSGANSRLRRGPGGSFPLPADFGGEPVTGPAVFAQNSHHRDRRSIPPRRPR